METHRIEDYFLKARQLPIALSLGEVQSIIQTKGVTSPPKKSWWNLNNIIIMTTSTLLISLASAYFVNTTETAQYHAPEPYNFDSKSIYASEIESDSTEPKTKTESIIIQEIEPIQTPEMLVETPSIITVEPTSPKELSLAELVSIETIVEEPLSLNLPEPLFESVPEVESLLEELPEVEEPQELFEEDDHIGYKNFRNLVKSDPKVISKEISADGIDEFILKNSHGAIKIESWDKPIIELTATITMEGDSEEDIEKGMKDFDISLNSNGNKVSVSHNWEELNNCGSVSYNWRGKKKSSIKTDDGEKVNIQKVQVSYLVRLPSTINLELKNTYADIEMGDLNADLKATLFKGDLHAGNIEGELILSEKYGDATVGNFNEGNLVFFKSKSQVGNSIHTHLKANYSELIMGSCEDLDMECFKTDMISEGDIKELEGSFKYGDMEVKGNSENVALNAFKAELQFNDINQSHLSTSYSSLKANKVGKMELENAFQSDLMIEELGELEGNLKYTPFKVNRLNKAMDVQTFKGSLEVNNIASEFSKFELQSKYTHVDLAFDEDSKFNLEAETAYTDLTFPSGVLSLSYQKQENHRSNLKGVYNSESTKDPSWVNLNFFQGSLNLK